MAGLETDTASIAPGLATETFYGGYAACFADPDGHLWEIVDNPGLTVNDDGTITLPDFGADAG